MQVSGTQYIRVHDYDHALTALSIVMACSSNSGLRFLRPKKISGVSLKTE